jgi:hypothetical protein
VEAVEVSVQPLGNVAGRRARVGLGEDVVLEHRRIQQQLEPAPERPRCDEVLGGDGQALRPGELAQCETKLVGRWLHVAAGGLREREELVAKTLGRVDRRVRLVAAREALGDHRRHLDAGQAAARPAVEDGEALEPLHRVPRPAAREHLPGVHPRAPGVDRRVAAERPGKRIPPPEELVRVLRGQVGEEPAEEVGMRRRRASALEVGRPAGAVQLEYAHRGAVRPPAPTGR